MHLRSAFLLILLVTLAGFGCSTSEKGQEPSAAVFELPAMVDEVTIEKARELTNKGYELLDEEKYEEAVAAFTELRELTPGSGWAGHHLVCAHCRSGNTEEALVELKRTVAGGWDNAHQMEWDSDLDPIRDDERFQESFKRAEANGKQQIAPLAGGLPAREAKGGFSDSESLKQWYEDERKRIGGHHNIWNRSGMTLARLDLETRFLAEREALEADSDEFDPALERVRIMAGVIPVYNPWNSVADGVEKEVNGYLAGSPTATGRNEANYWAGVAAFCRQHPEPEDAEWAPATVMSRSLFEEIDSESEFGPAVKAWMLMFDLAAAADNRESVYPQVKEFAGQHWSDRRASGIARNFFHEDILKASWPIPLEATALDGEPISLEQYAGKVVLVDFWATWCGPCRGELPHLLAAHEKFKSRGFDILSISLDFADRLNLGDFRSWIAENGMNWRHIYQEQGWEDSIAKQFYVISIPQPMLVGRDGSLAAMGGECRGAELEKSIEAALAMEPAA